MGRIVNEIGNQYGRLIVFEKAGKYKDRHIQWKCLCSCGNTTIVVGNSLRSGNTKSCGCLLQEMYEKRKLPKGEAAMHNLFNVYKARAKQRNLIWDLTEEQFKELTSSLCHYCGVLPKQKTHVLTSNGEYTYNGIDRIDNKQGYILENVVPCCGICNRMKMTLSEKEFLNHITEIAEHLELEK